MKVALYGRHIETKGFRAFYRKFTQLLGDNGIAYEVASSYVKFIQDTYGFECKSYVDTQLTTGEFDCLISLGGDGTALDTLSLVRDSGLPVMGVNLGRLGFLANIKMDEIEEAIIALKNGETITEKRALIQVECDIAEINEFPYALNDFVVQKRDTSAMIDRKSTRLNSSHDQKSYAVFCLKKKRRKK